MAVICRVCEDPLVIAVESEISSTGGSFSASGTSTVPDDLLLPCQCHFHWECFFEDPETIATTGQCPSCQKPLFSPATDAPSFFASPPNLIASYHSEGGLDNAVNLGPRIADEVLSASQPLVPMAKALHLFATEGDISGALDLLKDLTENATEVDNIPNVLLWQDPTNGNRTALHAAVEEGSGDVVWLLLWLVSSVPVDYFPEFQMKVAQELNLQRFSIPKERDIRGVKNAQGQTAEDIVKILGFTDMLRSGTLTPP